MHETKNNLVKGYIDSFQYIYNANCIKIEGWCFHEDLVLYEIRLKYNRSDNEIIYNYDSDHNERDDVSKYYLKPEISNCGWTFEIKNENNVKNIELQMIIHGQWETIFTFENYENKGIFDDIIIKKQKFIPSFIVIDNFYEDPDLIRKFALSQEFKNHENYHKGKRTDQLFKFQGLKESFESILGNKIKGWDDYGVNGCFQYCIGGDQLVYHRDSQQYAGVLFLTPDAPPDCGTTFYRSKYTKKMKAETDEEFSIVFKHGFLDSTGFDVVDVVGNVYNRLVLFDAQQIHSASNYFGNETENGRLFQIFFFDLEKEDVF